MIEKGFKLKDGRLNMLYFTFNNISQKNSLLVQENIEVSDVLDAFNNKLKMELGIGFNIINGINDLIGIPEVSFVINNDNAKIPDKLLQFVLLEYSKHSIEKIHNKSLQDLGMSIEIYLKKEEKIKQVLKNIENNNSILHFCKRLGEKVRKDLWDKLQTCCLKLAAGLFCRDSAIIIAWFFRSRKSCCTPR